MEDRMMDARAPVAASGPDIDNFIAKSQALSPAKSQDDSLATPSEWEEVASGVQFSDYEPKSRPPIPLPPVPSQEHDTGRVPNSFTETSRSDVADYFAEPGVCGLRNLGNTCYMNSGLQCLTAIPPIAAFYLSDSVPQPKSFKSSENQSGNEDKTATSASEDVDGSHGNGDLSDGTCNHGNEDLAKERANSSSDDKEEKVNSKKEEKEIDLTLAATGHVSARFSALMRKLWNGTYTSIVPRHFKTVLGIIYKQFGGFRQQDCQEFLGLLLDSLHEDIKLCNSNKDNSGCGDGCGHSVITSTFQGLLTSTVQCSVCGNVSIKKDPFSSLSVPIPHSHEKQIEVIWSRPSSRQVLRLLVTVPKTSTLKEVKLSLCNMVGDGVTPDHVTLAQIKNHSIDMTLGDGLAIRLLKPDQYQLYAFETDSSIPDATPTQAVASSSAQNIPDTPTGEERGVVAESANETASTTIGYSPLDSNMDADDHTPPMNGHAPLCNDPWQPLEDQGGDDRDSESGISEGGSSDGGEGLPAKIPRNEDTYEPMEDSPLLDHEEGNESEGEAPLLGRDSVTKAMDVAAATEVAMATEGVAEERKVVVMEWHSCAICLEEMLDSDLLTHKTCGSILCSQCIQSSLEHSSSNGGRMPCPICQVTILPAEDYTPLAVKDTQVVIRLLQITVLFRYESEPDNWTLFGHPSMLNLPSTGGVATYYSLISSLIPPHLSNLPWTLALTTAKGNYCSRCLFGSRCRGCVLNINDKDEVSLKPGDHLSVSLTTPLSDDVIDKANSVEDHASLESRWPSMVTLQDCLNQFSQEEVLGVDNPWWCTKCERKQEAIQKLTLSQLPPTLIIHLKRFLFYDNTASKVDTGVSFPSFLSSESLSTSAVCNGCGSDQDGDYVLTGCVCHFGTLNGGHYTAYTRHPVLDKWYYYNDESHSELAPSDKDQESAYILFYHRKTDKSVSELPAERGTGYPSEEEELQQLEPLLRYMKPPKPVGPAPPPPPVGPVMKRSSSAGNVSSDAQDYQLQQQIAASLGVDLPHSSPTLSNGNMSSSMSDLTETTPTSHSSSYMAALKSLEA